MIQEEHFNTVSAYLLEYETGDFLLLSDLSDSLTGIKDFFLETPEVCSLIEKLQNCIVSEMKKGGCPSFVEYVSSGVDLLQRFSSATDDETCAEIIQAITDFKCLRKEAKEGKEAEPCVEDRDEETFLIFLTEVRDRLDNAQETILILEENPEDPEAIQTLFRIFHTIKGECGFLKIATLGELTHNIENILDGLRSGKSTVTRSHIDLLLEGLDMSRDIIKSLEKKDYVKFTDISLDSYVSRLKGLSAKNCSNLGDFLVSSGKMQEADVQRVLQKQKESAFMKKFGEIAVQENYLSAEELRDTLKTQKDCKTGDAPRIIERTDPVIKVRASKVNFLVDMIGELLIAMGQISGGGAELLQMRKITRSLQYGAMELRTDSLRSLFGNLRRAVRDLSRQLEKNVRAECTGEDLEIDRNLIEQLEEPLMHLIRNSLDHGLEQEADRVAVGKDPQGTVTLKAIRHGNSIVITVRDDGHGLDRTKILEKAVERGLVRPDVGNAMSDPEVFNLIFVSGFSTHQTASLISGRGVGMEIVRSVVSENRGRIEVESVCGQYSEFRLIFPLSTAIIDGMVTRVSTSLLIFPIGSVIESIKIVPGLISSVNKQVEVANLRGESIPIIRMHETFGIEPIEGSPPVIGVICETSDRKKFMFILDEVIAKREVVIKSLGAHFSGLRGISSGTVLAGGKIGLVVDIDEIVSLSLLECQL